MTISERLKSAVWDWRSKGRKQYELANRAGLDPTVVSALLSGAQPIRENDARVLRLAKALRVPVRDAFDDAVEG